MTDQNTANPAVAGSPLSSDNQQPQPKVEAAQPTVASQPVANKLQSTTSSVQPVAGQQDSTTPQVGGNGGAMPGKYKIEIIREKCIGAASCVALSPKTLKLDDENIAVVIGQDDSDENKLMAAQSCPTAAVVVTDTETGEQVWPK